MLKKRTTLSLLLLILFSGLFTNALHANNATRPSTTLAPSTPSVNYIVIIMMENHPLNTSVCCGGSNGIIGNSQAPYITQLARTYGLAENYFAVDSGSLPDYLSLTGGSTFSNIGCVANDSPPNSCSIPSKNIVDSIEASGRSWKAYMEDYTGGCFGTNVGAYDFFHNPFPYFADIQNNTARCNRIVPANPGHVGLPDNQLLSDLNSTSTASNYVWLTPNENNNMHGYNGQPGSISTGDGYLSQLVPMILQTSVFTTQNAALFIVWDEPTSCSCPVPAIWVGPSTKPSYMSMTSYTHYSVLATIESLWSLSPLSSNDASASPMLEFFAATTLHGGGGRFTR